MIKENLRVGRGRGGGRPSGYKRILFHTYKGSHVEEGFRVPWKNSNGSWRVGIWKGYRFHLKPNRRTFWWLMLSKNRADYPWRLWLTGGGSSRVQATWPWRSLSILCSIISWFPPSMPKAILSLSIHSCPEKPTQVPSPSHSRPFPNHLSHFWIRHLLLVPFIWEISMYSFVALFQLNGYVFLVYQLVFMGFISAIRQQLLEGNTLILYLQNKSWDLHVANAQPVGLLPRLLSAYPVKIQVSG